MDREQLQQQDAFATLQLEGLTCELESTEFAMDCLLQRQAFLLSQKEKWLERRLLIQQDLGRIPAQRHLQLVLGDGEG